MRPILLSLLTLLCFSSFSQTLTGSWYGKADAVLNGSHNNYLTELIIKQKGDGIEGIFGYYFRNGYKSLFVRGTYNKKTRQFVLKKVPLTYFRSSSIDGVDCVMDFQGTVMASLVQTSITGLFLTQPQYKYTCPEFRVTYTLDVNEKNQDSLIANSVSRKLWQPQQEDLVITAAPINVMPATTEDTLTKDQQRLQSLVKSFEQRQTIFSKDLEVQSDSVRISFYDNGDIDGDSITVFLNKIPILTQQALTAEALNIYLKLDHTRPVNEITMYANNLGRTPPNTALMIVSDGENRHEVYLSSSLSQNASVKLKRKPSNDSSRK